MNLNLQLAGEWQLKVIDPVTRRVKRKTPWFKNLITNIGLDRIGQNGAVGSWCRIGTGTTAPANADTALVSQSASTSTSISTSAANAGSPDYQTTFTATFEFALGAVVGNMAEIGVGWASSGATLFSRARIVDVGGSPTTISVLVTEILQATYRLSVYPTLTDSSSTVTVGGSSYTYVSRVASCGAVCGISLGVPWFQTFNHNAYNGVLGAITGLPSGTSGALTNGSLSAYTDGTYYRDFTLSAGISVANLSGGISVIQTKIGTVLGSVWNTQTSFSPAIPKNNTNQLAMTWRVSWARRP